MTSQMYHLYEYVCDHEVDAKVNKNYVNVVRVSSMAMLSLSTIKEKSISIFLYQLTVSVVV
jgi:hypothetical protein